MKQERSVMCMVRLCIYLTNCLPVCVSMCLYSANIFIHSPLSLSPVSFPVPQLVAITSPLLVRYGSTATLKCRVQSLTIPTVKWTSNTNVILPSTSLVSSNDDIHTSTLKFKQVTLEYIGEYTCTAEHRGGEISVTFRLDVFGKVSIYPAVYL